VCEAIGNPGSSGVQSYNNLQQQGPGRDNQLIDDETDNFLIDRLRENDSSTNSTDDQVNIVTNNNSTFKKCKVMLAFNITFTHPLLYCFTHIF